MSKQRKKTRRDTAEIARENLEQIIGETLTGEPLPSPKPESKRTVATRKAGQIGGKSRADKLTEDERRESARTAARARWAKRPPA